VIVDAHVHLFPPRIAAARADYLERDAWFRRLYSRPRTRIGSVEELLSSMDSSGIERSVVAGFPWASQELCELHNTFSAQLPRDRLIVLCTVQPRAGQRAMDELARCLDAGFAGLGELNPDAQGFGLDEADVLGPLIELLKAARAPLLLHCSEPVGHIYPGKGHTTPDKVYPFALANRELTLVAAHWGGGLPFYYLMPEVGPALPNLYFDSAASDYLYDQRVFPTAASLVGASRVLFGSDYPLIPQERALRYARAAGLQAGVEAAFRGGNALAIYGR